MLRDIVSDARYAVARAARRRGWDLPVTVDSGVGKGLRLRLRHASADYHLGTNELPVQLALRNLLREGDVFYDVGGNIGFFSLISARLVGSGHVYAFEPVIENATCIQANAALNRLENVRVMCAAVGAESGNARLLLTRHPGGSTIAEDAPSPDFLSYRPVPVVAIDDLVASKLARPPSVVKIDVEGGELDVLRGMRATMAAHGPFIVCELDDAREEGLVAKLDNLRSWLKSSHYELVVLPRAYPGGAWHVLHVLAAPTSRSGEASSRVAAIETPPHDEGASRCT